MYANKKISELMKERRSIYNQVTELTSRIKQNQRYLSTASRSFMRLGLRLSVQPRAFSALQDDSHTVDNVVDNCEQPVASC